ncbi:MAG: beta-lactamase family protein, partial [Clostridia bacterium]|nr:beta-lactamase family protein [Clostridia bacterium]
MALTDAIRFFTEESKSLACMSIVCGNGKDALRALGGKTDLEGSPVTDGSLFDLASLTKLFTAFLLLKLWEEGRLALEDPVVKYAPMFKNLAGLSILSLASFETGIQTDLRVDACTDRESALAALFSAKQTPQGVRAYSDMHAMVLKYVIEGACGMSYMDELHKAILRPLGMSHTFCAVPEALKALCVSTDREHRFERGKTILRRTPKGLPHDPKARVLCEGTDDCPGHAGLFSTAGDLENLCRGVLLHAVLGPKPLEVMAMNRTGRKRQDGSFSQFLGLQCYVKHPDQYFSEIPAFMGRRAIGISGFTGNHLAIDPENS